ncbi:MAG: TSUP family transporter [Bacteroidetes bacterium]|nr:TSUP family transporter [Bacteroidota bacterium]MBU1483844.1 TSUP family transporter [Bacteroidota bacterium]MBU2045278.1 TSUP family transporter [Bacteroidota bacterium]MBU2268648.1 TSUP family transporter [Bacteroidota bacterium]MBU2374387.1 TSUP family transporter [Bacteroidota bacterium]
MSLLTQNKENIKVTEENGNELFPVFLKLQNFQTLLVGGGNVGLEKLSALLANSPKANVTVVADRFLTELKELAVNHPSVKIIERKFEDQDLEGAELVILATDSRDLHVYIRNIAKEKGLLLNVADTPELCDFYLGSIVKKGNLKIAISTNGKSPTVAKRIKEVLNENIPDEIDDTLEQINKLRLTLSGDFAYKVKALNQATASLVAEKQPERKLSAAALSWMIWSSVVIFTGIILYAIWQQEPVFRDYAESINPQFYWFLGAGFIFAMIDGAIGMSYGVTSTTFSLSMGIPPASASTAVHISEIFSNGIAGWMHYRMGNINKKLLKLLLIPGIIGAVLGAFLLSSLEEYAQYTKPLISVYTLILGIVILRKSGVLKLKKKTSTTKIKRIGTLGFTGGFIDAVGGGGWGSIVLSSLIAGGRNARYSLGTVKLSRFFIALMSSLTFVTMLDGLRWYAVAGLVLGSAVASPIAARVSNRISAKTIMVSVGVIVILVSLRSILKFFGLSF